jgi:molybdopterin-guanine dinucleotide biosynthesis protein A
MKSLQPIAGVILAGGRSSRMEGQFKAAAMVGGELLLQRVIDRFQPQVNVLLVNLNQRIDSISSQELRVIADSLEGYPGPLAGLVAAFEYLDQQNINAEALAVVPCDGPFLPKNVVAVLASHLVDSNASVACIRYDGQLQPTFSLWHRSVAPTVIARLREQHQGGFKGLFSQLPTVFVNWPQTDPDPFFNINTPEELSKAEQMLGRHPCH